MFIKHIVPETILDTKDIMINKIEQALDLLDAYSII